MLYLHTELLSMGSVVLCQPSVEYLGLQVLRFGLKISNISKFLHYTFFMFVALILINLTSGVCGMENKSAWKTKANEYCRWIMNELNRAEIEEVLCDSDST